MIDIHSHVLWGLDDGADTLQTSIAMLRMAAESGTTEIVATPHANFCYPFQPEVISRRVQQLSEAAAVKPRIHTGCDFHLSFENVQDALAHPAKYVINRGPYLLVEFPDAPLPGAGHALETLLDHGFVPVITHPERNADLRRMGREFLSWIGRGCLVQITAQSLLGDFGRSAREAAWEMVRRDAAHIIASDAHDTVHRPPRLDTAYQALVDRYGESVARALAIDHPAAVLAGTRIEAKSPKKKSWLSW